MGADILGLLTDLGGDGGAIVMGCSVGSRIALMLACDRPDIISAAILIGGQSGSQNQFDHRIAGHCCFLEKPHIFDGLATDFLKRRGLSPV